MISTIIPKRSFNVKEKLIGSAGSEIFRCRYTSLLLCKDYNYLFYLNFSLRLETGIFAGRPADYLTMLTFNWVLAVIVALFMNIPMLLDPMVLSVLYVWCQLNRVSSMDLSLFGSYTRL